MKFAVLDFETTGTQSVGEIIQVGLAIIEEDRTISRVYGSYVKPGGPIPLYYRFNRHYRQRCAGRA